MDPLSVIGGVIALIGAVKAGIDSLIKLRAYRNAPEEIAIIINEVISLSKR
jgi:hypothetical protein